jgi:rhamnogalacturonan hydrolase
MWTVNQNEILNQCKNVYGTGYCAGTSTGLPLTTFTTTATTTAKPSGFTSPVSPAWGVSGYGITIPIPVYTPAVFWSPASSGVAAPVSTSSPVFASTTKASATSTVSVIASPTASTSKTSQTSASSVILVPASSSSPSSLVSSSTTSSASTKVAVVVTSSTSIIISSTTSSALVTGVTLSKWAQCGGQNWSGSGTCASGTTCTIQNQWYSQCL